MAFRAAVGVTASLGSLRASLADLPYLTAALDKAPFHDAQPGFFEVMGSEFTQYSKQQALSTIGDPSKHALTLVAVYTSGRKSPVVIGEFASALRRAPFFQILAGGGRASTRAAAVPFLATEVAAGKYGGRYALSQPLSLASQAAVVEAGAVVEGL